MRLKFDPLSEAGTVYRVGPATFISRGKKNPMVVTRSECEDTLRSMFKSPSAPTPKSSLTHLQLVLIP